ncbi:MAG TPA: sulfite exporter TauE/SafE family protein [Chthoniobacteraceae bacterium]|jgi:hypothetical protein
MSGTELTALAAAAAAAGVINAIAGGGTLVTFPVLMLFGTSPIIANATSTLALTIGTVGSIFGYREQMAAVKPWLRRFVPVSIAGGWCGSLLLTHTNEAVFAGLVPFLILFATVLFLAQGAFRRFAKLSESVESSENPLPGWFSGAVFFQFAVAIYGGYFGAGIGILMLASLGLIGLTNIHQMNALKTVLGSLINFVAAAWFTFSGLIDWPRAGVMVIGALVGYYFGAHYAQRFSQQRVRQMITAIGLVISAVMFYRQFR